MSEMKIAGSSRTKDVPGKNKRIGSFSGSTGEPISLQVDVFGSLENKALAP